MKRKKGLSKVKDVMGAIRKTNAEVAAAASVPFSVI